MVINNDATTTMDGNHQVRTSGQMVTLNIHIPRDNLTHAMQFDVQMFVADVSQQIQAHLPMKADHDPSEYGLFINDTQHTLRSYWLDSSKTLNYYVLKNGTHVEYKNRYRPLKIRLLDGTVKTILIDDSLIVAQLMVYICTKFGIANYDEYSLVYDLDADDGHQSTKTATLRRDRSLQRGDKKMEELRKKCHTDDDTLWLDQSKTLRQQEIDEQSTVVLRRKYFFSDTNIDQRDPVQLNLLYVQCRNGIVDETHPVTFDEALQFSGLQCQIQFGDYEESKHKPGLLDLRDFLPKEYTKTKHVEKKIFSEHKTHRGLSELDGKVKYTQLCRSLRTYGVTFFLVKEKMSGKNKLVPRLLGVTKDSIVRVDERSKDFLEVWPLTHVKRWTASPNTFTLDFGDYATAYYSVQTHEGQQISQLIAGYIDIILKKKKDRDGTSHERETADEEATMIEDIIAPGKATIIQPNRPSFGYVHQQNVYAPPVIRGTFSHGNTHSDRQQEEGYITSQIHEKPKVLSDIHQNNSGTILFSTIENARNTLSMTQSQLPHDDLQMEYTHQSPSLSSLMNNQHQYSTESRLDVSRQLLSSELSTINAATAQIIIFTSDFNRSTTDANHSLSTAISTITNNLNEFCQEMDVYVRLINDQTNLTDQTHRLCATFDDLLTCIQTIYEQNSDSTVRQNVLLTASRLGEINQDLLRRLTVDLDCSIEYQDKLLSLAKSVANTTALYVLKAKDIATNILDQHAVNEIISTATQCALATSQLVACTKIVAATISSPLCQEQLIESARNVTRSIEAVLQSCSPSGTLFSQLVEAGRTVRRTLNEFLLHIKLVTDSSAANLLSHSTNFPSQRTFINDHIDEVEEENDEKHYDESLDQIITASDSLFSSVGDAVEMVKQTKVLAQATAQLVSSLKKQAESVGDDTNQQEKLLTAARMLTDATAKLVECARGCATKPHDLQAQYQLKKAVEDLRRASHFATSEPKKRKIFQRLGQCAKYGASCATQCIAATSASVITHQHQQIYQELVQQCKIVADLIPKVVQGIRSSMIKPESYAFQNYLLNVCEDFLEPATHLTDLARMVGPIISDQSQALHLNNSSKQLTQALTDLGNLLRRAQELFQATSLDVEAINDVIEMLHRELNEIKRQANDGYLRQKSDQTIDVCSGQFTSVCQQLNAIVSQLLTAINQNDDQTIEHCTHDLLHFLHKLITSARHIIATSNDPQVHDLFIERLQDVLQRANFLFREAKKPSADPNKLCRLAHELSSAMNTCLSILPSQRYLDEAIKQMSEYVYTLAGPFDRKPPQASINSEDINRAAANLNQATTELVVSTHNGGPQDLAKTSARFSRAFGDFIDNGIDFVHQQQEDEKRSRLIITLKSVHTSSSQLLERAKSVSIEPTTRTENDAKHQLANAARTVTETINDVITACLVPKSAVEIERSECDHAIHDMETAKTLLQQAVLQPCANYSYFEALDNVVENSKRLGEAMTHIASASKNTNHQLFKQAVQDASKAVCRLTESSAQASYLIGLSEGTSTKGTTAVVDQLLFNRSVSVIRRACTDLSNPSIDRNDILTLAAVIAKNTAALCNISRDASMNTTNITARRHFVQSAKDIANATAELVRTIKMLNHSYTHENHRHCIEISRPLIQLIDDLHSYAMSKEFASIPATISSAGRQLQEPILLAARNVVDGACRIVECSKMLIVNSKEASLWQQLATHTKSVSEAIKRLATSVKEMTPGQQECERAVEELRKLFQEIDKAILNLDVLRKTDKPVQFHQEQITSSSHLLTELIQTIRQTSKSECERIGSNVIQFIAYLQPFIRHTIDYISGLGHKHEQILLLEQIKSLIETTLQLILSTKESAGNLKNIQWHKIVDNNSDLLIRLIQTIAQRPSSDGTMKTHSDTIRRLISTLDTTPSTNSTHCIDYHNPLMDTLRRMIKAIQEIDRNNQGHSRQLAMQLIREYNELIHVIGTAGTTDLAKRIKSAVQELGIVLIDLIETIGHNPSGHDSESLYQKVIEQISSILTILQTNVRGTQACISAASTVSSIIADLDTTVLFATAGSLNSEHIEETFSDHREAILKTAKALVEDTKTLVAGAASSQEQLASAAHAAVRTITKLADVVKLGAASLGANDGEAQVMLINSIKDVALALNKLINVTKSASGKTIDDPEMQRLKESAKTMVTNVTSLLRTVKTVEDETQRGTNALESTIESIGQELQLYNHEQLPIRRTTPEEFIRVVKQITIATSKAVSAGQSCQQEDIIIAANFARKAITDLLNICQSSAYLTDEKTLQRRTLDQGRLCVESYKQLLETIHVLIQKPSNEIKQKLLYYSRVIAQSTQELVQCAGQLKGTDLIDPDDPTYIAENELSDAAQSIESAAKKLSFLKPRRKVQEINANLNFDEQMLDAAKSIMNAAGALITAATSAQKELVAQGKLSSKSSADEDGQWSQGLISAARYVASACHVLCDAANGLVQGYDTEEKLISSAKQVSSNTAALLVACKVKADFMSQSMARLQNSGNAVKRAADALVRSAQQTVDMQREEKQVEVSTRFVPGIAQEIKCKEAILTKERELDQARNRLKAIRLAKYGHSEQESNDST